MRTALQTTLRQMTAADIVQVADVERESFPSMWPQTAYKRELENKLARYLVLTELRESPIDPPATGGIWGALRRMVGTEPPAGSHEYLLGFIGLWLMVGEAHIVTVAVRERYRRMGIGERLVIASIELAIENEQEVATLEVRASNDGAQRLYAKYGFARLGLRKRYYTDNNEDAVIMTTPDLYSTAFRARFDELRAKHRTEYPDLWD
jgi:[ribosomal protein S18]-alanine N-acetyltransferase